MPYSPKLTLSPLHRGKYRRQHSCFFLFFSQLAMTSHFNKECPINLKTHNCDVYNLIYCIYLCIFANFVQCINIYKYMKRQYCIDFSCLVRSIVYTWQTKRKSVELFKSRIAFCKTWCHWFIFCISFVFWYVFFKPVEIQKCVLISFVCLFVMIVLFVVFAL